MGIYDREYYRRDGPRFLGSLAENGVVCKWLIGINIVCFLLQILTRTQYARRVGRLGVYYEPFTSALVLNVAKVLHGQVWRLITYGFLHDTLSIWHIVFNMLFLFWFGRQVEERIGPREFLAFYLTGLVAAGLAYVGAYMVGWHNGVALGASGAMAVLVLAALANPRQVIYLFFVLPVPIWGFVVFLVVMDAFNLLGRSSGDTATAAHLGGAAFGFVYSHLRWRLTDLLPSPSTWKLRRVKPQLRLYREEDEQRMTTAPPVHATAAPFLEDEQLEAQMDAILAKIPRVGMEGLTEKEHEVLRRASEAIKRRRG